MRSHIFVFASLPEFTAILMFEFWREATVTFFPGLLCQFGRHRPKKVSILSSLKQRRRRRQRERQKSDRLDKENNNFVNAALFFVHFFAALLDCDMRLPNFTRQHYGVRVNTTQKFSFSFSKLRYVPFGFNP